MEPTIDDVMMNHESRLQNLEQACSAELDAIRAAYLLNAANIDFEAEDYLALVDEYEDKPEGFIPALIEWIDSRGKANGA